MSNEVNPYCSLDVNLNTGTDQDQYAQLISQNLLDLTSGFTGQSSEGKKSVKETLATRAIAATQETRKISALEQYKSDGIAPSVKANETQFVSTQVEQRYVENFNHKRSELGNLLVNGSTSQAKRKVDSGLNPLIKSLNEAKQSGKIGEETFGDIKSQLNPLAALNGHQLMVNVQGELQKTPAPAPKNLDEVTKGVRALSKSANGPSNSADSAVAKSGSSRSNVADVASSVGDSPTPPPPAPVESPYMVTLKAMIAHLDALMAKGHTFEALMYCLYTIIPDANNVQEDTVNGYSAQLNHLGDLRDDVSALQGDVSQDNTAKGTATKGSWDKDYNKLVSDTQKAYTNGWIDAKTAGDLLGTTSSGAVSDGTANGTFYDIKNGINSYGSGLTPPVAGSDAIIQAMWINSSSTDTTIGPPAGQAMKNLNDKMNMTNQSVSTVSGAARTKMKYWMDKIQQLMGFENNLMHAEDKMVQSPVDNQKTN